MLKQLRLATAAAALFAYVGQAGAVPLSFAGTFTSDDNLRIFNFSVTAPGTVSIETFSYAGGTDPVRGAVAPGGFDPVFGLFTASGALVAVGDDGATRLDPVTGAAFDAFVSMTLTAGNYFIALAEYDNYPIGPTFASGFTRTGTGNFTSTFGCSVGRFCDVNGFSRTGNFDVAISGTAVAAAPVPEPSTFALMSVALAGVAGWARRRRTATATQPVRR